MMLILSTVTDGSSRLAWPVGNPMTPQLKLNLTKNKGLPPVLTAGAYHVAIDVSPAWPAR